jgi:hypothetical protein
MKLHEVGPAAADDRNRHIFVNAIFIRDWSSVLHYCEKFM